ncbi:Anthranilate O-methyltransferase 1, partial [Dichanthelium oligosanthes]
LSSFCALTFSAFCILAKGFVETKPVLEKVVAVVCSDVLPLNLVVADLGWFRLFPFQSVHLFHSSFSLHWHSQFPDGLDGNKGNIYIARTTPPSVVKLYQEQFQKDLMLFLELRDEELALGGQMVLTFLGRKNEDVYSGNMNYLYELLGQSLQCLVEKDLVNQKKLDSLNLPIYGASVAEVKEVVNRNRLFDINHIKLFESNWDPYNDSEDKKVLDSIQSGVNVAKSIRVVMETLFVSHFGESMIDAFFKEFANKVAEYLQREDNTKYSVIVLSLKRKCQA